MVPRSGCSKSITFNQTKLFVRIGFRECLWPIFEHELKVGLEVVRVKASRGFYFVDLFHRLEGDMKGIHVAVSKIKKAANHGKFDDLLLIKYGTDTFKNIISRPSSVFGYMLCPEDSCFLPLAEKVTVHVVVRSNNLDLLFRDACRLTKRRIVSQSIIAPIGMARFDNYHFL